MADNVRPPSDRTRGQSDAERAVLAGLDRLAAATPGLSFVANAFVHVGGARRELDVLIMYRGRTFGIEVDGPHHARQGRYVADASRTLLFEDCGLLFVRRIAEQDTNTPGMVDTFLRACVDRLRWWGSAA